MTSRNRSSERKTTKALLVNFTNGTIAPEYIGELRAHLECPPPHEDLTDTGVVAPAARGTPKSPHKENPAYLIAETDKLKYKGKVETASAAVCYYLGIRDPKTGKMQIVDASKVNMSPMFQAKISESHVPLDETYQDKVDSLTNEFGSLKKKRRMNTRKSLKLDGDELEKTLEKVTDHHVSTPGPAPKSDETESVMFPPCNREAEKVQNVYLLTDIISDKEMSDLTYAAEVFVNCTKDQRKEWKEKSVYPSYIVNHLSFLPLEEEARLFKCKCLMYLYYLMHLYRLNAKALKRKYPLPPEWPMSIRDKLYDGFMVTAKEVDTPKSSISRCMPSRYKDKTLFYIFVLALLIDEFQMELTDLMMDLKIGVVRITQMLRFLGCRVKENRIPSAKKASMSTHFAELSLPLAKVQIKQKRRGPNPNH